MTPSPQPSVPSPDILVERRTFVVEGQSIPLHVARPGTAGSDVPGAGAAARTDATVILLGAIWSVTPHIEDICNRLAAAGIAAIAPCLFRGRGIPARDADPDTLARTFIEFDDRRCIRDLKALVALAARGDLGFDAGALVPWGFCLGGRFAHFLAATTTQVAGVVNFYGRIRFARQPVKPFLPIELAGLIAVPYLGHFAETDALIPAQDVADLRAALDEHGVAHRIEIYPGTKHSFFDATRPADHHPDASVVAWDRSLAFIRSLAQAPAAARPGGAA